jgi:hypothetical protein
MSMKLMLSCSFSDQVVLTGLVTARLIAVADACFARSGESVSSTVVDGSRRAGAEEQKHHDARLPTRRSPPPCHHSVHHAVLTSLEEVRTSTVVMSI